MTCNSDLLHAKFEVATFNKIEDVYWRVKVITLNLLCDLVENLLAEAILEYLAVLFWMLGVVDHKNVCYVIQSAPLAAGLILRFFGSDFIPAAYRDGPTSYSSQEESTTDGGTLASDERLAALREKLTGN